MASVNRRKRAIAVVSRQIFIPPGWGIIITCFLVRAFVAWCVMSHWELEASISLFHRLDFEKVHTSHPKSYPGFRWHSSETREYDKGSQWVHAILAQSADCREALNDEGNFDVLKCTVTPPLCPRLPDIFDAVEIQSGWSSHDPDFNRGRLSNYLISIQVYEPCYASSENGIHTFASFLIFHCGGSRVVGRTYNELYYKVHHRKVKQVLSVTIIPLLWSNSRYITDLTSLRQVDHRRLGVDLLLNHRGNQKSMMGVWGLANKWVQQLRENV